MGKIAVFTLSSVFFCFMDYLINYKYRGVGRCAYDLLGKIDKIIPKKYNYQEFPQWLISLGLIFGATLLFAIYQLIGLFLELFDIPASYALLIMLSTGVPRYGIIFGQKEYLGMLSFSVAAIIMIDVVLLISMI